MRRSRSRTSRAGRLGAIAAAIVFSVPMVAAAAPRSPGATARSAATVGSTYGGATSQEFPVVIEVNKSRRQIVRALTGVRLTCTSGAIFSIPDSWSKVAVTKKGKFSTSFGPGTTRNPDGTTTDVEGSFSGAFNAARTTASGRWQLKVTEHDQAGAVTDTCDSGSVSWKAKQ